MKIGKRKRALTISVFAIIMMWTASIAMLSAGNTESSWNSHTNTGGTFAGAQLGSIRNLQCFDAGDNGGILGTKLLTNEVLLAWEAPQEGPLSSLTYKVVWDGGWLGSKGEAIVSDGSNSFRYKAGLLGSILSFSIKFQIYPVVGNWQGPPVAYVAKGISTIVSVTLEC